MPKTSQSLHPLLVLHPIQPAYLRLFEEAGFDPIPGWERSDFEAANRRVAGDLRFVLTSGSRGLSAAEMDLYPKLEMICALGAGYENIDRAAARGRGVVVTFSPGANAPQVADHAIALILAMLHDIPAADRAARTGAWKTYRNNRLHPTLTGRRLGILGFGRIGRETAGRAAGGFATPIAYSARTRRDDVDHAYFADPQALAEWAEIVVVATPGGPETRHLVDAEFLSALGPDGYLVNVSRGSVVDTAALVDALRSKTIAGAALDVVDGEPDVPADLADLPNILLTPHIAGHAPEAVTATIRLVIDNLAAHLEGRPVPTPVPD